MGFGGLSDEDRALAVELLSSGLKETDLRAVVDGLDGVRRKSVEQIIVAVERKPAQGRPRLRLPHDQLAQLLVDRLGVGLLENSELRVRLAYNASDDQRLDLYEYEHGKQAGRGKRAEADTIGNRKWHPGKRWARLFVHVLGFPMVYAGLPGFGEEAATLEVAPFVPLPDLADFQQDLKEQARAVLDAPPGDNRAVLTMPTGAGKTRTAVETVLAWRLGRTDRPAILWIAQSEELCEQAVQAFAEVWTDLGQRRERVTETLTIGRYWATRSVPDEPDVVVASIQKLQKAVSNTDERHRDTLLGLCNCVGVVVVDEAHRIHAGSYREVLDFFAIDLSPTGRSTAPLLGLTATPFRADTEQSRRLGRMFHNRLLRSKILGEDMVGHCGLAGTTFADLETMIVLVR